jgi:ketosteroid isomerase-like protein
MRHPWSYEVTLSGIALSGIALFGMIVSFALGVVAYGVWNVEGVTSRTVYAKQNTDMAGIEKLHQLDQRVTLLNDPQALQQEWANDAVRLEPDGPADVGKAAIYAADMRFMKENPGYAIVSYKPDIRDVQVLDDWAYEWGYFDAGVREGRGKPVTPVQGKLLRVLHRESGGDWKFARVMVTFNAPGDDKRS